MIRIGAATETEMKEKKARVEDALNATRAAVEEGIVVGGGVALVRCLDALDKVKVSGEEKNGINLLKRAIGEPLKHIAVNAGHEGSVVLRKVMDGKDDYGFNAESEKYENLVAAGVIDPDQSGPPGPAERRIGGRFDDHNRGPDQRKAGEEKESGNAGDG